jgi:hypothetical protein
MTLGHNGGPALREGNWIAVSRDMIEHHIVGAGNMVTPADKNRGSFSRLESWLDLLSMANYAERKITVAGATLVLKPGQTLAGRAFLAKRWNWSEKAVRTWLAKLEAELMITLACEKLKEGQAKGHGPNVLSVCNWGRYQIEPVVDGPPLGMAVGPPKGHTITREQEVNKKGLAREGQNHGREYWSTALAVPGAYNPDEGCTRDPVTGAISLVNGTRQMWLGRFGGDEESLDLALKQAAAYVQPNAYKPIKTQVEAQLAGIVRQERERQKRYDNAKQSDKPKRTPTGSDWAEIAKKARAQEDRR